MSDLEMRLVSTKVGRLACRHWHYSGTLPTSKLIYGFYYGGRFDGVIVFRRQLTSKDAQVWWEKVFDSQAILELVRIALRPQDERPPTTRYMSMAIAEVRKLGYDGIASYADTGQGHTGGVYKAASWTAMGIGRDSEMFYHQGRWMHGRSFSDVKGIPRPKIFRASHKLRFGFGLTRRGRKAMERWLRDNPMPDTPPPNRRGLKLPREGRL